MSRTLVIGSGFSGLSAACFLAKNGYEVTVLEKNGTTGGRARAFKEAGFTFDMGPSWYWMPDIFERFFASFGKKPSDYYELVQLAPGFQMIFGKDDFVAVPSSLDELYELFEKIETGSAKKLRQFLKEGAYKYDIGMRQLVYRPSLSIIEFLRPEIISGVGKMHLFSSVSSYVRRFFKDERLIALMEFPVLFLGATAQQIPALYSLMNYAALSLGTWYPMGGMVKIIESMSRLAEELGVKIQTGCEATRIITKNKKAIAVETKHGIFETDNIIASGDYHYMEQLLDKEFRNYNEKYWQQKTFAPSCLIFYIGINKKIKKLIHHNLFFDASLNVHARELYQMPQWPSNPLFYVCCPSKTDDSVAPVGMENLFLLMPLAVGLEDTEELREKYYLMLIKRLEVLCEETILPYIAYRKSYCINDFVADYYAYKGNAYGLANTLKQTAILKPTIINKKLKNLFYAGQLTVPGPGVPPALISGQVAAELLLKNKNHSPE